MFLTHGLAAGSGRSVPWAGQTHRQRTTKHSTLHRQVLGLRSCKASSAHSNAKLSVSCFYTMAAIVLHTSDHCCSLHPFLPSPRSLTLCVLSLLLQPLCLLYVEP